MKRTQAPLILVAGVCGSGKSTLVKGLLARGYRARSVAQEHSGVPQLWTRKAPDFLVVLDCELDTIRRRRQIPWGEERLRVQRRRLAHARRHCHLYLPTDDLTIEEMVACVIRAVKEIYTNPRGEQVDYPGQGEGTQADPDLRPKG